MANKGGTAGVPLVPMPGEGIFYYIVSKYAPAAWQVRSCMVGADRHPFWGTGNRGTLALAPTCIGASQMKTQLLYLENSFMFECSAKVVAVEGDEIALDATVFFPGGGGQMPDHGTITWDNRQEEG